MNGDFAHDMGEFSAAVERASIKMKQFSSSAAPMAKALARLHRSPFSEAVLLLRAIDVMGGWDQLTHQEQRRAQAIIDAAVREMLR